MSVIPFIVISAAAIVMAVRETEFTLFALGYFGALLLAVGAVFSKRL